MDPERAMRRTPARHAAITAGEESGNKPDARDNIPMQVIKKRKKKKKKDSLP